MLPVATKDRILDAFPDYFRLISSGGGRYQYTVSKWWAYEDHDHEYPELVFDATSQAVTRTDDAPADDHLGRVPSDANPDTQVDDHVGRPVLDEWTVTVACRGQEYGVSARDRADIFAERLYEWLIRRSHGLDDPGANANELPVNIDVYGGITDTSEMTDDTLVQTRALALQLKYVSAFDDTKDTVAGYEGTASTSDGLAVDFSTVE